MNYVGPLSNHLRRHGLVLRHGSLIQGTRVIGKMTAAVGWALVRILDDENTDDCRRCDVYNAQRLRAGIDP